MFAPEAAIGEGTNAPATGGQWGHFVFPHMGELDDSPCPKIRWPPGPGDEMHYSTLFAGYGEATRAHKSMENCRTQIHRRLGN